MWRVQTVCSVGLFWNENIPFFRSPGRTWTQPASRATSVSSTNVKRDNVALSCRLPGLRMLGVCGGPNLRNVPVCRYVLYLHPSFFNDSSLRESFVITSGSEVSYGRRRDVRTFFSKEKKIANFPGGFRRDHENSRRAKFRIIFWNVFLFFFS